MVEYEIPDRDGDGKGELIALITTITEATAAPAGTLAQACHQRWEHEKRMIRSPATASDGYAPTSYPAARRR